MSDNLPPGWSSATISDVAIGMKNGLYKPAASYAENGVACLRMYNIEAGRLVWKNIKRMKLTPKEVEEYQLLPGDLLVNRVNSRELVGKTAVFPRDLETCVFESKNIRVRLHKDVVCPELVSYMLLLSGPQYFSHNAQQVVGMASISQPQLAAFEIRLPPINEQRRIVWKIEQLIRSADAARERLVHAPTILKRFRQAVLACACSGCLTADWREAHLDVESAQKLIDRINQLRRPLAASKHQYGTTVITDVPEANELDEIPDTWCWVRFGSIIGELRNGISTKPEPRPPGTSILRISSVRSGAVILDGTRFLPNSDDLVEGYRLRDFDLLFTRYNGSLDLLGVCGMVRGVGDTLLLYPDKLMRVRFDHPYLLPSYAEIFFQSAFARDRMTAKSKSSAGQQGISGADVKAQPIAVPPLQEQGEIVRRVEALFKLADAIEKRVAAATARAERLTQAILAKAFRGELVPTEAELARREGRSYEPASTLLARVRTLRPHA